MERIGMFGGTFDPPHNGHIAAAVSARHQLGLDRVLMVVAGDPWQKRGQVVAPAAARLAMVELACDGINGLVPCDIEVARAGATYTIDTVEALTADHNEVVLILGADAVAGLDSWHRAADLARAASIALFPRRSGTGEPPVVQPPSGRWRVTELRLPRLDISSTMLRDACAHGEPIDGLVPPEVVRYIREHRLYTRSDDRGVDRSG